MLKKIAKSIKNEKPEKKKKNKKDFIDKYREKVMDLIELEYSSYQSDA